MTKTKSPYIPEPAPPTDPALRRRYEEVMAVLSGTQTVSGAAKALGMARNTFQSILHRGMKALLDEIMPKPAGRPAKPEREVELEAENARLRSQLSTLQDRAAMIDRLMDVVGGLASGREPIPRQRSKPKAKNTEDPEPGSTTSDLTSTVIAMRDARIPTSVCARLLQRSPATIRRRRRAATSRRPSRVLAPTEARRDHVKSVVRATRGLCGVMTLIERERKAACQRVLVSSPGVMRGFDAMYVDCLDGLHFWLIAADAAVSFRTTITFAPQYDARHVIETLEADFAEYGPPLVLRIDRAACQRTPDVLAMLEQHGVLVLHGPPRHPYFYGQTERQNREHRAWIDSVGPLHSHELAAAGQTMRTALNALWARPTLDWCTAEEVWQHRAPIEIDRVELREDVERCADRLVGAGVETTRARRIATESALTKRGLLTIHSGGQC
jgi:transposase InsO family protein